MTYGTLKIGNFSQTSSQRKAMAVDYFLQLEIGMLLCKQIFRVFPMKCMPLLCEAECWKLFCRTAIPDNDTGSCPPELKEYGEKMVKKCVGLPLAIVVLGGLLSSKNQSPTEWENVLNNLQAHFSRDKGVDAILSLSYIELPHN